MPDERFGRREGRQVARTPAQRRRPGLDLPRVGPRGGEVPYFSLEYCRGIPLILAIRRVKLLEDSWPWMVQLLRALDYIHRMGWLHRDLKPGNVLVVVLRLVTTMRIYKNFF